MADHRIAALCIPRTVAFDLGVASEVFTEAWSEAGPLYEFEACGIEPGEARTTTGFTLAGLRGLEALAEADTVLVPGYRSVLEPPPDPVLDALRAAHERGARVVSICTGAFALAWAGLLDGRRVTTHWFFADKLGELFPRTMVEADLLYVDEGPVLTSAGLSAGIDLCLHMVRSDFGEEAGRRVARIMVAPPHRDGGQTQYIDRPLANAEGAVNLAPVLEWALANLDKPLDVATMAERAAMSPRHFARRFVAETGSTPLQWLLGRRVAEARRMLEQTDLSVEAVAERAGFGSPASLRAHFRRAVGTSPAAYRTAFRAA